jgi:hypothetical protein
MRRFHKRESKRNDDVNKKKSGFESQHSVDPYRRSASTFRLALKVFYTL